MAIRRTTGSVRTPDPAQAPVTKMTSRRRTPADRPVPETAAVSTRITVSEDTRRSMIEQAAYLRAERRGFAPGREEEDWLAAEAEVNALLKAGNGRAPQ